MNLLNLQTSSVGQRSPELQTVKNLNALIDDE